MARVKGAVTTRKRRNKILKAAKGYWGAKSKHFKMAKQAVLKSGITLNRKMLAELAVNDKEAFASLVETAKKAI